MNMSDAMKKYLELAPALALADKGYRDSPYFRERSSLLIAQPPCGCSIEGDSVIPNPLHIRFCAAHAAVVVSEEQA